jgi:Prolyl oligopeptidase family
LPGARAVPGTAGTASPRDRRPAPRCRRPAQPPPAAPATAIRSCATWSAVGTPWQKDAPIDVYWDASPLKYIANVKTPTIFLVGERDVRVPMPQSVEMSRGLKSLGVPTRLDVAPREPLGFGELRHQLFKVNAELAWFEQWVGKRPYTWEKAPGSQTEP